MKMFQGEREILRRNSGDDGQISKEERKMMRTYGRIAYNKIFAAEFAGVAAIAAATIAQIF